MLSPITALVLLAASSVPAVTIVSGPTFTKAANAPLAGLLQLTTDEASRVAVLVSDGITTWQRQFYDLGTSHSIPLLGFKPGRTNTMAVTVSDRSHHTVTSEEPLIFVTAPLPSDFLKTVVLVSDPARMEPGYTLFRIVNAAFGTDYLTIMNNAGEVVWYSGNSANGVTVDVRQLDNGDLFFPRQTSFVEINMLGDTIRSWPAPTGWPINVHDGVPTDHGTILYLSAASRVVTNFPTSSTDPNAPLKSAKVEYDRVVEISATNGMVLNSWSLIDMLDPARIDYLTFKSSNLNGWDGEHANALIEDPRDNSIIVSLRNQDAVIKFSRATGALKWILGPHENWGPGFQPYLLTPVGEPFEWNYAQHAPKITPQGTLLLYDDGNYRASPFDAFVPDTTNHSRAVEFDIDEGAMEVSQVWEYGTHASNRIYTASVGNATWLPQRGNVLITFGNIAYLNGLHPSSTATNASMARITEVTHDPSAQVVFDLVVFDYNNASSTYRGDWVYRSFRIPDLYPHPAAPVADLTVHLDYGIPLIEFSADPVRLYVVESSTDLAHWQEIGTAVLDDAGIFEFEDDSEAGTTALFYRVVTK